MAKDQRPDARVIDVLEAQSKTAVIPPKRNRTTVRDYDKDLYKARHLIENFFAKLKQYRAIATRTRFAQIQLSRCNLPRCYCDLAQLMTRPRIHP